MLFLLLELCTKNSKKSPIHYHLSAYSPPQSRGYLSSLKCCRFRCSRSDEVKSPMMSKSQSAVVLVGPDRSEAQPPRNTVSSESFWFRKLDHIKTIVLIFNAVKVNFLALILVRFILVYQISFRIDQKLLSFDHSIDSRNSIENVTTWHNTIGLYSVILSPKYRFTKLTVKMNRE